MRLRMRVCVSTLASKSKVETLLALKVETLAYPLTAAPPVQPPAKLQRSLNVGRAAKSVMQAGDLGSTVWF
jgi:hypothetical protein